MTPRRRGTPRVLDRGGIIDAALVAIGLHREPYVHSLVSAFSGHAPARLTPYPGAIAALERLHAVVPVVLVTDGNPLIQHAKIAALGLGGLVDHVVVSDDLGGRAVRKPHPAPFRHALALLDLPPADVVHVGDRSAKDVAGAHGVGMRCLRVRTGSTAPYPTLRSWCRGRRPGPSGKPSSCCSRCWRWPAHRPNRADYPPTVPN